MNKNLRVNLILLLTFILIFFWSYFSNLGGDLSFLKRIADFADEGYWLQNPINKIKYNIFLIDDQSQSFFGAPLYNIIIYFTFKIFGISFFNARFLSVLILICTSIIIYKISYKIIPDRKSSFLFAFAFIFLYDNRIYYQWSTPVPLEILFQSFFLYFIIFHPINNVKKLILLFILVILSYASKATSIFLFPFSVLIIYISNTSIKNRIKLILIFILLSLIIFYLKEQFFTYLYFEKYTSFKIFLFSTIKFDFILFFKHLNPIYFLRSSLETFKFPNSTLIYTIVIFLFFEKLLIHRYKKEWTFIYIHHKSYFITFAYIAFYILYLLCLNSYGIDRRQINLIVPFYLLFIFSFVELNFNKLKTNILIIIYLTFFILQSIYLTHILNFNNHFTIKKIFFYILIFLIPVTTILLVYKRNRNLLFTSFIFFNGIFHLFFNRTSETLLNYNHHIYNSNFKSIITGVNAHHLSVENNAIPIWWLDTNIHNTYPSWNQKFKFYNLNKLIVSTDLKLNASNGYFTLDSLNSYFYNYRTDTIYLYQKFDNIGFLDTNLIKYYKHK
jgi:hypothetical protein